MKTPKNGIGKDELRRCESPRNEEIHENPDDQKLRGLQLYQAITGIDDAFILNAEDAQPIRKTLRRRQWGGAGVLAACVLLVAVLTVPRMFSSSVTPGKVPFAIGVQMVSLKQCNVQTDGLKDLEKTLREYVTMPEKLNVASFSAQISPEGVIEDFDLLLFSFDDFGRYKGMYRFEYNYSHEQMTFTMPEELEKTYQFTFWPKFYNENFDVGYISEQLKRIPLTQQIPLLNFNKYALSFNSMSLNMAEGQPIIDAGINEDIPVLSLAEYDMGLGGISDGEQGLYVQLYNGVDRTDAITYKMMPLNPSTLEPSMRFTMKRDYHIDNNKMRITRDYGKTWIDVDIPAEDIKETMDFYRSKYAIPENSFFISEEPGGIIAVIYGETPKLRLSRDDGATWQTVSFDLRHNPQESIAEKPLINRITGFTSDREGYVALGSDWSMGSGEMKFAYFTHDGGLTWSKKALPFSGTSDLLTGMSFVDSQNGIVSLKSPFSPDSTAVPLLLYTNDGGEHWAQTELPEDDILKRVYGIGDVFVESVHKVDSLSYDNGVYTLICGKGSDNSVKAKFQSRQLCGPWEFVEAYRAVVHSDG